MPLFLRSHPVPVDLREPPDAAVLRSELLFHLSADDDAVRDTAGDKDDGDDQISPDPDRAEERGLAGQVT